MKLGVVGAGTMGVGIACTAAMAGHDVRVMYRRRESWQAAEATIAGLLARAVAKGKVTGAAAAASRQRITGCTALADLAPSALVFESIIEDLAEKRAVFAALDGICREDCILATNTSSLSVTQIAAACRHRRRIAGMHFFNPVSMMRVVEIIGAAHTDPAVCDRLEAFAREIGKVPVRAQDQPGFLVNHAGRAYPTEALRILEEGIADHAAIDRIMHEAAGFPMGPFELLDLIGLQTAHRVMESIYRQFYHDPRLRPVPETAHRLAAGLWGRATGNGFYAYPDGKPARPAEPLPAAGPLPAAAWISPAEPLGRDRLAGILSRTPVRLETGNAPSAEALCLVTPIGADATTTLLAWGLDPRRTVAVDTLTGLDRRRTLMTTPATDPACRAAAHALLAHDGTPVTVINDSPGFVGQRILAMIVNLSCDIAQRRIAAPADIDRAIPLALGYPMGPLSLGDALGPATVLRILKELQVFYGDPRYRPSPWLARRAALGLSLTTPEQAV